MGENGVWEGDAWDADSWDLDAWAEAQEAPAGDYATQPDPPLSLGLGLTL